MAVRHYLNTVKEGVLSTPGVGTGNTTFNLDGGGLVNLPVVPFVIRVDADTATEELCLVTAGSPTALTVTRGFDGTSAFSHAAGAKIRHVVSAEFFEKADTHVESSTNVHGLTGGAAVVGTTQLQTVTGKTINSSVIDVAHSTSPASAFAVRVNADAVDGRDGFLWNKTAAATGKAFRTISGGVDRTTVDADGKTVLNSPTGTDKVLSVQEAAVERTYITAAGTLVLGPMAVGATLARLSLQGLEATQQAIEIKDSGGVVRLTINPLGVHSMLSASGTSTLTGDVTLPLPSASTTPRLTVQSRTGGVNWAGKDQAGTTTSLVKETGEVNTTNRVFIFNNASPVSASVTSTAVVPTPNIDQVVFQTSDRVWYRYDGSIWVPLEPLVHMYQENGLTQPILAFPSTPVAITMTGEHVDTCNGHSTTVNTSRYTPTIAGTYQFWGAVAVDNTLATGTGVSAQFRKNGALSLRAPYGAIYATNNTFAANICQAGSATFSMNGTTDYVELYGYSAVNTTTFANATDQNSYLIGRRIGGV